MFIKKIHLISLFAESTLCNLEYNGKSFPHKTVKDKKEVTCKRCLDKIKRYERINKNEG